MALSGCCKCIRLSTNLTLSECTDPDGTDLNSESSTAERDRRAGVIGTAVRHECLLKNVKLLPLRFALVFKDHDPMESSEASEDMAVLDLSFVAAKI